MASPQAAVAEFMALDDHELVALARQGAEGAFRAVMARNSRRLYRVARSIVRDDGEAEDVVQESCVRAFAGLAGFRGEASLSTWLTRVVLNEALGRVRRMLRDALASKLASALADASPFAGQRCARLADAVLARPPRHGGAGHSLL